MESTKPSVHFTDKYLLTPTNPVIVNLIGAGGTGSQVLTALGRINISLVALGHPGIAVKLFDDDLVTSANMGRQLFTKNEIGFPKSVVLINRLNRFFGTNWKAHCKKVSSRSDKNELSGNIIISCVDSIKTRFEIASVLKKMDTKTQSRSRPVYWMDFGNSRQSGQVILSTIGEVKQPASEKYLTHAKLPYLTDEFKELLKSQPEDLSPSCSMAEALHKQDLFINTTLSALGASLLWSMFREGMTHYRGFFLNLKDFKTQPIPVK
ncbi:MAG: PRTRC system ThiF family protein [Bacteroidota bacterium]